MVNKRYTNAFGSALDSIENDLSHIKTFVNGTSRFEITESGRLSEKEKTLIHELKAGDYHLHIQSLSGGKFDIAVKIFKSNNSVFLDTQGTLYGRGKQKDYTTYFTVEADQAPAQFELKFIDRARFWQNSSFDFKLVKTGVETAENNSDKAPTTFGKKYKVKIYFGDEIRVINIQSGIKLKNLMSKFKDYANQVNLGENISVKYVDEGDVITIETQEGLDSFFDGIESEKVRGKIFLDSTVQPMSPTLLMQKMHELSATPSTPASAGAIFDPESRQRLEQSLNLSRMNLNAVGEPANPRSKSISLTSSPQSPNTITFLKHKQYRMVRKWQKGNAIGAGAFGKVYLGMNEETSELIAIKEINLNANITQEELSKLEEEISLMSNLNNEHIVHYLGSQKTKQHLYIFLDYIPGGTIESILADFKLTENIVRRYTSQILQGLAYLHDNDIIHRDIKSANLLVDELGHVYLADFGCSKKIQNVAEKTAEITGTPNYIAPEVIRDQLYTKSADIWSLGCTVLEMLCHKAPWYHVFNRFDNPIALMHYIMTTENDSLQIPDDLDYLAKDFLQSCLQRDPTKRATVRQLQEHPFLNINEEEVDENVKQDEEAVLPDTVMTTMNDDGFTFDHIADDENFSDSEEEEEEKLEGLDLVSIVMDVRQEAEAEMNECKLERVRQGDCKDNFSAYYSKKKAFHSVSKFKTVSGGVKNSFDKSITWNPTGAITRRNRFSLKREDSEDIPKANEQVLLKYLSKNAKEQTSSNLKKLLEH